MSLSIVSYKAQVCIECLEKWTIHGCKWCMAIQKPTSIIEIEIEINLDRLDPEERQNDEISRYFLCSLNQVPAD